MPKIACTCCNPTYQQAKVCPSGPVVDVWVYSSALTLIFALPSGPYAGLCLQTIPPDSATHGTFYDVSGLHAAFAACTNCSTNSDACLNCGEVTFVLSETNSAGSQTFTIDGLGLAFTDSTSANNQNAFIVKTRTCSNFTRVSGLWTTTTSGSIALQTIADNFGVPPIYSAYWVVVADASGNTHAVFDVACCPDPASFDPADTAEVVDLTDLMNNMDGVPYDDAGLPIWDGLLPRTAVGVTADYDTGLVRVPMLSGGYGKCQIVGFVAGSGAAINVTGYSSGGDTYGITFTAICGNALSGSLRFTSTGISGSPGFILHAGQGGWVTAL